MTHLTRLKRLLAPLVCPRPNLRETRRRLLELQRLEDRLTPATFSISDSALTITLAADEQLSLTAATGQIDITDSIADTDLGIAGVTVSGSSITIDETVITSLTISDGGTAAGAGVAFVGSSTSSSYTIPISVALSNAASSDVTFSGASNFADVGLSVQTAGASIISTATSAISLTGADGSLLLSAGNDETLLGSLSVAGTTGLQAASISADNPANSFSGDVSFDVTGGSIQLQASGPLTLGDSSFNPTEAGADSTISASGNITLDSNDALTGSSAGPALDFNSTVGSINLTGNGGNDLSFAIGATATGNNSVTLANNAATELGNISVGNPPPPGTAALTVTSGGTISQVAGTAIITAGAASFLLSGSGDIDLNQSGNDLSGAIVFDTTIAGTTIGNATLVNNSPTAPVLSDREGSTPSVSELTLSFESSGVTLPALSIPGALNVTAAGSITQSGPIVAGSASFDIVGDYGLTLDNPQNEVSGDLDIVGPGSSQPASYESVGWIELHSFQWGIGRAALTSVGGSIVEDAGNGASISQEQGAGPIVFEADGPSATVSLMGDAAAGDVNDFTNYVVIRGQDVTTVAFENGDPRASIDSLSSPSTTGMNKIDGLTLPQTVTNLTLQFDAAPIDFDSAAATAGLSLTALSVTAPGIRSDSGSSSLTMNLSDPANQATFNAESMPIDLIGNGIFDNITLENSGPNAVIIDNTGSSALNFTGDSELGYGPLTLISSAGITENSTADIVQTAFGDLNGDGIPDAVSLASSGPISLDSSLNEFTGSINTGGIINGTGPDEANLTITNGFDDLVLGNIFMDGTATLTATSLDGSIWQSPGSVAGLNGGGAVLDAGGDITLENPANGLGKGTCSVAAQGSVGIAVTTPIVLGNVSAGSLSLRAGGAIAQATGTSMTVSGEASFAAGQNNITLNSTPNSIATLDLNGDGSEDVVDVAGNLTLNQLSLGTTALSVSVGGTLSEEPTGAISQTGSAPIALTAQSVELVPAVTTILGPDGGIYITGGGNNFLGSVTLSAVASPGSIGDVALENAGNLSLASGTGAIITGSLDLTAGGTVTLPSGLTSLVSLSVTASQTTVGTSITITGNGLVSNTAVSFTGNVSLAAGTTIDASAADENVTFEGNVEVTGNSNLSFAMGNGTQVILEGGTWNEGSTNLDFLSGGSGNSGLNFGNGVSLEIGPPTAPAQPAPAAVFSMNGGDLDGDGLGVTVDPGATLSVGSEGGGQTVAFNLGNGNVVFAAGSTYEFGQGTTNAVLDMNGDGILDLTANPTLFGDGPAGTSPTPIFATTTAGGAIHTYGVQYRETAFNFFDGGDIVNAQLTADATGEQFVVGQAGASPAGTSLADGIVRISTTGTFHGYTTAGDPVTITTTPSAGVTLAVLQTPTGYYFCIRKEIDASSPILFQAAIKATKGPGTSTIYGFADWGTGPLTISAAEFNLDPGDDAPMESVILTAGTLAGLTVHNIGSDSDSPFVIKDAGTGATTITAAAIANTDVNVQGVLSLKATSIDSESILTAAGFGTIATTGNAATGDAGNMACILSVRKQGADQQGIVSVKVAGNLSGTWIVNGNVGTVAAESTGANKSQPLLMLYSNVPAKKSAPNGSPNSNGNIGSLNLGVAGDFTIDTTGAIGSLTAVSIDATGGGSTGGSASLIQASSIGKLTTTGSAVLGDPGNCNDLTLDLTGSLGTWSVSGNLEEANLDQTGGTLNPGDLAISDITVGGIIEGGQISTPAAIGTITAGGTNGLTVRAISISFWKQIDVANPRQAASIANTTITLAGASSSSSSIPTLGSLSAAGPLQDSTLAILQGSIGTITAGALSDDTIDLENGGIGTLSLAPPAKAAGDWSGTNLIAASIGSVSWSGPGDEGPEESLTDSLMVAYGSGGGGKNTLAPTLAVPGDMEDDTVVMPNGIASVAAEQGIESCYFLAGDPHAPLSEQDRQGKIGSLSSTSLTDDVVEADALGSIDVTGPQGITGTTIEAVAAGSAGQGAKAGDAIGTITVTGSVDPTTSVTSLGGISSITIGNTYRDIVSDPEWNWGIAPNPNAGTLGSLTAGDIEGATIEADFIGSLKVAGNAAAGLAGNLDNANISAISSSKIAPAIGTISVAGNCLNDSILAWGQASSIKIGGTVEETSVDNPKGLVVPFLAVGLDPVATDETGLGTLAVGALSNASIVTQYAQSVSFGGSLATGLAGTVDGLTFDVLGNLKGTGLNTFTAAGGVSNANIDVAAGNVGSVSVGAFLDSNLRVGAYLPNANDPHGTAPSFAGNFSLGSFKTTASFDPNDPADSAAFQDSVVAASTLGAITLSSVDPVPLASSSITSFGVFFNNGTDGGKKEHGMLTVDGGKTALTPSDQPQPIGNSVEGDAFYYEG